VVLTFPPHVNLKIKNSNQDSCECDKIIKQEVFFSVSDMNWIGRRKMVQKYVLDILPDDILKDTNRI
jgi:hypothetical protein